MSNKEELKQKAIIHTKQMSTKYGDMISKSVQLSTLYNHDFAFGVKVGDKNTQFIVEALDTVSAIFKYKDYNTTALNFASFKNPGGGFMVGSKAQEECLCHESNLYNILSQFNNFYEWNSRNTNKSLYVNRGIYSPSVVFERQGQTAMANIISVAAPNKSAAVKYNKVSNAENKKVLSDRIRFVLDIAVANNTDTLILGAFGCGVFGQNSYEVAELFAYYLTTEFKNCFSRVIFAIPQGKDGNFTAFRARFNGR